MVKKKKIILKVLIAGIVILIGMQFIPANTTNPPVTHKVKWDSTQTQETFMAACADCHSNETVWPWYSKVAPLSYWIAHHVNHGREYFNISQIPMGDSDEAWEAVHEGWMPLESFTWMHSKARLTQEQRAVFSEGLKKTFGVEAEGSHSKESSGY